MSKKSLVQDNIIYDEPIPADYEIGLDAPTIGDYRYMESHYIYYQLKDYKLNVVIEEPDNMNLPGVWKSIPISLDQTINPVTFVWVGRVVTGKTLVTFIVIAENDVVLRDVLRQSLGLQNIRFQSINGYLYLGKDVRPGLIASGYELI